MQKNLLYAALVCMYVTLFIQKPYAQNTSPYWSLAGNSTATTSSKLGTTNSIPLRLVTANLERLRIDALGKVGIGTTSPVGKLTLFNTGSLPKSTWVSGTPSFVGYAEGTAGSGDYYFTMASNTRTTRPNIILRRARGTLAAPLAVINNDFVSSLQASAYDGSSFQNPANVEFFVDGTPSTGNVPVRISFTTGSNLSNRLERLKIGSTGNIAFNDTQLYINKASGNVGIGTISPSNKLHVEGGISTHGVYAEAPPYYDPEEGIYHVTETGVTGVGLIGIHGKGFAYRDRGTGVLGTGGKTGVHGNGDQYGITGNGNIGVLGYTADVELPYEGEPVGVYGISNNIGVFGAGNGGGIGVFGTSNWGHAGFFEGSVYMSESYITSDNNMKKDIEDISDALTLINKLKPKHYIFRSENKYASMNLPKGKHYGLIAQDLEEVLPSLIKEATHKIKNTSFNVQKDEKTLSRDEPQTPDNKENKEINIKAVNYIELIPIVVKGVQELDIENKKLKEELTELKDRLNKLEAFLNTNKGIGGLPLTSAYLEQNSPNPANTNTVIRYNVPNDAASVRLTISNVKGQVMKDIGISNRGSGQINLNASAFAAGTYTYILWVNGQSVDIKRLVITK